MKMLLVGVVAILLGVGGGSFLTGSRLKSDILVSLEEDAGADQEETSETPDTREEGSGEEPSDPIDDHAAADSMANQLTAEERPAEGSQESDPPVSENEESIAQEPTPTAGVSDEQTPETPSLDTAIDFTVAGGQTTDTSQGIDPEASRAMARIFAAMRPEDAAAVLQGMENPEVQSILLNMADRQAAAILGGFDANRAATLAQLVLSNPADGS